MKILNILFLLLAIASAPSYAVSNTPIDARAFGVKCNGSTNDAANLQKAVNAAINGLLILPPGVCNIGSAISINGSLAIQGSGRDITFVNLTNTSQDGFDVTSAGPNLFSDFTITSGSAQIAGNAIKIDGATPGATVNFNSIIKNIRCTITWACINFQTGEGWTVEKLIVNGIQDAGIVINNLVNADGGDNQILNSTFSGTGAAHDAIRHFSSGGLQIIGNKFQDSGTVYHVLWNSTTGSSQISLLDNHIEQQSGPGAIIFERTAVSGGLAGINIAHNYFNNINGTYPDIWFKTNALAFAANINISGNTHNVGTAGTAIQLDGGTLYTITGNTFQGNAGTSTGIATGNATATVIYTSNNKFSGITALYAINTATQIEGGAFNGNSSIDFGNVLDGTVATNTVTVPGAVVGDICFVSASQLTVANVFLYATISAANTATVSVWNKSGGAWLAGAGTVRVSAYRLHP